MGIKLKLNGKPLVPDDLLPIHEKVRRFLESKPDEVFDSPAVAQAIKTADKTIRDCVPKLPKYSELYQRQRYWGVPSALAEFRRVVGI